MKAVLFKSEERFDLFSNKLDKYNVDCTVLDFSKLEWIDFDYSTYDFLIYYPSFEFSSNFPLALARVHDNLVHIHQRYPHVLMYPDPKLIRFYNDKYHQYLFLKTYDYPIPETIPLFSEFAVESAHEKLGYPMVVKDRYGAGGGSVFLIHSKEELETYYRISQLDLIHLGTFKYFFKTLSQRIFFYHLIKARKMMYPFLSPPLLAQKFITTDRDLKTVVGNGKIVEGHWRFQASSDQWKVNIDGGGIGQWSHIPDEAIAVSERLARELDVSWINLDLMQSDERFLITEFSPVWHHYKYQEKPSFVYKNDYNIEPPLEVSLDLERLIVKSLIDACKKARIR